MDSITVTIISFFLLFLLGFLVNYLFKPDIRRAATHVVFFSFAVLLIFSSLKMLYTGEMGSFSSQEGEIKIFMGTHPLQFWGSLIFQLSLGCFMLYALFLKTRNK